jgi:hypothetical protein
MRKQTIGEAEKAHFLKAYLHPNPTNAAMVWDRLYAAGQLVFVKRGKLKAHYKLARLPRK